MQESIIIQSQQKKNELMWMDFVIVRLQKEVAVHPHKAGTCSLLAWVQPCGPSTAEGSGLPSIQAPAFSLSVLSGRGPYRLLWCCLSAHRPCAAATQGQWAGAGVRNSSEQAITPWCLAGDVLNAYPKPLPQLLGLCLRSTGHLATARPWTAGNTIKSFKNA